VNGILISIKFSIYSFIKKYNLPSDSLKKLKKPIFVELSISNERGEEKLQKKFYSKAFY